jgi:hypothetical protein
MLKEKGEEATFYYIRNNLKKWKKEEKIKKSLMKQN